MKKVYLIGSLRNPRVPALAQQLRNELPGVEVFDDWFSAGPEADDHWKAYEQARGRSYKDALNGYAARHVFGFDKGHLDTSTHAILVLPAGKSGHMEVMYAAYGVGAKTAILLEPDADPRWDVMYQFVPNILYNDNEIKQFIEGESIGQRATATGFYGEQNLDGIIARARAEAEWREVRRREASDGPLADETFVGNLVSPDVWGAEV